MLNLLLHKWLDRLADKIVEREERLRRGRELPSSWLPMLRTNSHFGHLRIGETLTFYAATSLQTGAANDADSAPTYLIYEDENATQIVTSTSMALLDSSETNGLYSEEITLAESTGYEFMKDYLIYITATVSTIVSHAMYTFRIGPEGALDSANAQAGAAGTITLKSGASATDDLYNGLMVAIISGTGVGQVRTITDYVGSTKVASVEPNWITNPSSSSIYAIFPLGRVAVHTGGIASTAFAAGAIDAAAIADGAIDAATLASGTITSAKFAAGAIDASAIAADAIGASELAADAVAEIADGVWDEATSGHTTIGTFGQADGGIRASTAQAGAATTITLDAGASATDDFYNGSLVYLTGSTGAGQARTITDYVGSTKVATVSPAWTTNPSATSQFVILPQGASSDAASIADAVWDEARAGHATAGTFGEGVSSVQGNVTGSVASVVGNVGGNVTGSVGSVVGNVGGNVTGSVGSVVGNVGGNVAGNVTGSVGSVAAGGITAASIATGAIDADALAADAATEIRSLASGTADSGTTSSMTDAARTEADDDYWVGSWIVFTSGNIAGQARMIDSFGAASDTITFVPPTTQPVSNQTYEIWPAARLDGIEGDVDGDVNGTVEVSLTSRQQIAAEVWDVDLTTYLSPAAGFVLLDTATDVDTVILNEGQIQSDIDDIQTRLPASLVGGRMRSHVEAMDAGTITAAVIATAAIDADALATDAVEEIADGVWDEDIVAAHGTADTSGLVLSQLTKRAVTFNSAVLDGSVFGQIADDGTATFDRTTDSLQAIADSSSTPPSAATIADAVWDELRAGHVGAGSFGEGVASVQGNVTGSVAAVVGNVGGNVTGSVGSVAAGGITAASFGAGAIDAAAIAADAIGSSELAASAVNEIADQVWDELRAGHVTAGSFGEGVASVQGNVTGSVGSVAGNVSGSVGSIAAGGITAGSFAAGAIDAAAIAADAIGASELAASAVNEIADQVWDELRAGHVGAGSFGEGVASVQGNVTGSVGSVVGNVGGSVGSVVGSVGGNVTGSVGSVAANGITASSLATSAVDEIVDQTWDEVLAGHLTAGSTGAALDAAGTGGATDWTAPERAQIRQALGVTGATAATTGAGTLELAVGSVQADTDDLQGRLPPTLNGGRMRSHVEACDPPCQGGSGGGSVADQFEMEPS